MPTEQTFAVAPTWRLIQIVAEVARLAIVSAFGLPAALYLSPSEATRGAIAEGDRR